MKVERIASRDTAKTASLGCDTLVSADDRSLTRGLYS